MSTQHESRYCDHCHAQTLAIRNGTNHILHLLLTVLTFGLWLLVWAACSVKIGNWRCSQCGSETETNREKYTRVAIVSVVMFVVLYSVFTANANAAQRVPAQVISYCSTATDYVDAIIDARVAGARYLQVEARIIEGLSFNEDLQIAMIRMARVLYKLPRYTVQQHRADLAESFFNGCVGQ